MQNGPTETSVLISLHELVSLEDERLAEEEEARRRAEAEAERAKQDAIEHARAAEEARRLAEEEARVARAREQAEQQARLAAIAQAELERARVEARATAARAARETELAHERALAAQANEREKTKLKLWGVGVLFAVVLGAGGLGVMAMTQTDTTEDPRIAQLEREQAELLRDRLGALDALHERLQEKLGAYAGTSADFDAAHRDVVATRAALRDGDPTDAGLDAYEAALDRLATEMGRAHRLARLTALREVHDELAAKADATRRPTTALKKAAKAAEAGRKGVDAVEPMEQELDRYDASLRQLAVALADQPKAGPDVGRPTKSTAATSEEPVCTDYHDPLCARLTRD